MEMNLNIHSFLDSHLVEARNLLIELAQIPAPSHYEQKRAEFCARWLREQGADGVFVDDTFNVVYPIGCTEFNDLYVFIAHSDVVFPDTTPLPLTVTEDRILCPGVGDDTANVVALMMAAKYIARNQLIPKDCGILLIINSCEEGLGNLKGCREIMKNYGHRIREFITFDGYARSIMNRAVGSRRYQICVETEGGHSYSKFGNRNAIAELANIIASLYAIAVPKSGKTTFNVGTISGGTSVNTIAQYAEMLYEFRSDEKEGLEYMEKAFRNVIHTAEETGLSVTVTQVGDRPCSGVVNPVVQNALTTRAMETVSTYFGISPALCSGSTDCNIPLSMGIPAVCVSCIDGAGAHTRGEYILLDSQRPGLSVALSLILHHF